MTASVLSCLTAGEFSEGDGASAAGADGSGVRHLRVPPYAAATAERSVRVVVTDRGSIESSNVVVHFALDVHLAAYAVEYGGGGGGGFFRGF